MSTPSTPPAGEPEECGAYNPGAAVAGTYCCRLPRGHDGPHDHRPPAHDPPEPVEYEYKPELEVTDPFDRDSTPPAGGPTPMPPVSDTDLRVPASIEYRTVANSTPPAGEPKCPRCDGAGSLRVTRSLGGMAADFGDTIVTADEPCSNCNGTGRTPPAGEPDEGPEWETVNERTVKLNAEQTAHLREKLASFSTPPAVVPGSERLAMLPVWIVGKLKTLGEYYEPPTDDRDVVSEIQGWMHVLCFHYVQNRREVKEYDAARRKVKELETRLAAAESALAAEREKVESLESLVTHCWVHSGYKDCGFDQMDSAMRALYREVVDRDPD